MKRVVIETDRLILRLPEESDAQDITDNINNKEVVKWLSVVPYPYGKKDALEFISSCHKNAKAKKVTNYNFVIELKSEHKVIGGASIMDIDFNVNKAELGCWLGEKYWRQHYMEEAFRAMINYAFSTLKLNKLYGTAFDSNPRSPKMLEKLGFRKEGILRQETKCRSTGDIHDVVYLDLLRNEWKN